MKSTGSFAALAALLVVGASYAAAELEFPESFPLHKRQSVEPGTPRYECHAACGGIISISRTEGFCENPDYDSQLDTCLKCANTFSIWQYYSGGVGAAAAQCNDDATPSPSGYTDTPSATPSLSSPPSEEPSPEPTPEPTPTPSSPPPAATTEESSTPTAPETLVTETVASTVAPPATTSTSGASGAPTPPAFTGAASPLGLDSGASFMAVLLGLSGFFL